MYIVENDRTLSRHVFSRTVVASLLMLVLGWRCGPSDGGRQLTLAPTSDEPVVTVASTTQMEVLNETLPDDLAITRAYAVRVEDRSFGHFVAAKLRRPSDSLWDGKTLAIWYMPDGMDVPGAPFAVDSTARSFGTTPAYEAVDPGTVTDEREIAALLELTLARP